MMQHRLVRFSVASVFVASGVLLAQKQLASSAYDPGIRTSNPASIQAETEAESAWFAHLQVLAGDDLNGRRTGTPDFIRAVEYVESQFKAIGLKPAGVDGYREQVGFRSASVDAEHSSLELVHPDGQAQKLNVGGEVSLAVNVEGPVSLSAPAVFAGYGLEVPVLGLKDVEGIDLHGKVAVIFGGSPAAVHGPLKAYFRTSGARWKALRAAGAVGLITIPEPRSFGGAGGRAGRERAGAGQPEGTAAATGTPVASSARPDAQQAGAGSGAGSRPAGLQLEDPALNPLQGAQLSATVPSASAEGLFAGSPHTLEELQAIAKNGGALPAFPLAITIRATTTTKVNSRVEAPNVVGVLEGSDPKLKHEYLIVSAHLDHLDGDSISNSAGCPTLPSRRPSTTGSRTAITSRATT